MGYQLPVTIGETIKRLQSHDLVLPAIQREFIWKDRQIEMLFDSLMRGYPIGSFLSLGSPEGDRQEVSLLRLHQGLPRVDQPALQGPRSGQRQGHKRDP
jgi:hypothetical protein